MAYLTTWIWYYADGLGKWERYGCSTRTGELESVSSDAIELAYQQHPGMSQNSLTQTPLALDTGPSEPGGWGGYSSSNNFLNFVNSDRRQ